jgi:hypothetical protein
MPAGVRENTQACGDLMQSIDARTDTGKGPVIAIEVDPTLKRIIDMRTARIITDEEYKEFTHDYVYNGRVPFRRKA